jgi:hypothetical protein
LGKLGKTPTGGGTAPSFQSPLGEVVWERPHKVYARSRVAIRFQSPLGEVVWESPNGRIFQCGHDEFQSPIGEVVWESIDGGPICTNSSNVSIPSRGSGLGKSSATNPYPESVSDAKSTH